MDSQDELLNKEDPRFYAIDKFNTGLGMIATEENFNSNIVGFGLPSSVALFLNLAQKSFQDANSIDDSVLFDDHEFRGKYPNCHTQLFNLFENLIAHVVFSFTALEAFANISIPDTFEFIQDRNDKKFRETYSKEQTERNLNLDTKLGVVLPQIFGVQNPKGGTLWAKYVELRNLRDRIIHLKSLDTKSTGAEIQTLWGALLEKRRIPFCDNAYEVIGYYAKAKTPSRWFHKYPYRIGNDNDNAS